MSSQNEVTKLKEITTQTKHPSILEKSALSCVKCAKCVPTCTIYGVNRDEITSPRGYLDLANAYAKGRLLLDKQLKDSIESCFLCTSCVLSAWQKKCAKSCLFNGILF